MNYITGIIFVGIAFVLAVRSLFVKAIFNIPPPVSD
jgi:hypothetical protein